MLLKNIVHIKGGKRLPKGNMLTNIANSHPYIKVKDMKEYITQLNNTFEYVPNEIFSKIANYTTNTNDILLSIVGTIGNITIVGNTLNNASLTENCVKMIVKNSDKWSYKYIYYFLISSKGKELINNGIVGSTQPKLPLYNIENIDIPELSLSAQQHIVDYLLP